MHSTLLLPLSKPSTSDTFTFPHQPSAGGERFFLHNLEVRKIVRIFAAKNRKRGMKTTSDVLDILRDFKPTAERDYGFTKLGVFGSVARGEQTENSDLDICYEGKVPSLLTLDLIQTELERRLGCHVDLVRIRKGMNSMLQQRIQREGMYV